MIPLALLVASRPRVLGGGLVTAGLLALAGVAPGAEPARDMVRPGGPAADTILWRNLLAPRPLADRARGGVADGPAPLRLGLKPVRLGPGLDAPEPPSVPDILLPREQDIEAAWLARIERWSEPAMLLRTALLRAAERPGRPAEATAFLPPPDSARAPAFRTAGADTAGTPGPPGELEALFSEYADLGMRVQARAELGGDWRRFRPCETRLQESCTPTLLPRLSPDLRFNVQVGGSITDRIFVDVDFDQLRELESANTINIVYEGAPDAVVRRLEVGDVNFQLPPSRFLTEGIPAGNFGFRADAQVGPVDVQGVWAEQQGDLSSRVFRLSGVGNDRRFVQEDTVELDDADYARGQFFFLVDPREIVEYPHLDVLALDAGSAPAPVVPGIEPVQVYRFDNDPQVRQQVEGGAIQADAVARLDGDEVVESSWFRYLEPGRDYFVHPSGLWIALRDPLAREEMLAVTYVTAAGDTVGDYNPERLWNRGDRPELQLLKASGANHQPGRPTWEQEMHNVYRVSGGPDVEQASVEVTISLGALSSGRTFKRGPGEDVTFLRLFGLDRESPVDQVDPAAVYSPGGDLFEAQPAVPGTFLVFPTLEPFHRPAPLRDLGLSEEETAELLGEDANGRIYTDPDPFERENGGRFRLTIPFRVRSEGVITSFSLGALGVLAGSERLYLDDQLLVQGVDYEIDYDVGQVTLLDPEGLFAASPEAAIRATWEQRQLFRTAPTTVFGLNATTGLGRIGDLDFIGLYRTEKTLVTRPTLGVEPGAVALGGANGRLNFEPQWLDRALAAVPGLRSTGSSTLTVDGEAALSFPDPNTRRAVFLDDFDTSDERPLSLLSHHWARGSAPISRAGAEEVLPLSVDETNLAELVWQHTWIIESPVGDSVGVHEGFLPQQEIDQRIRLAGGQRREPGLRLSFDPPEATGQPGWASATTVLSSTGADLTRSEFLEFYAAGEGALTLVVDLGLVSEDAMFVDPDGATTGTKENGVPWGLGMLDQEADPRRGEVWGNDADARGVWGEECLAEPGRIYRIGDRRAVCTRGNGRNDSEDLDGDGNLDETESHLRYVVRLDGSSPYLARNQTETGSAFQLYRIPIRGPEAAEVGGPFTDANLRNVRHIRVTVAGPSSSSAVTLARMRILGSRWVPRAEEGVAEGIVGDTAALQGRVEVTTASRLTEGDSYQSPPGVLEELADPASAFGAQSREFNEKSLAIRFQDVQPGDRAEVFNRFTQRPRDFLTYRRARLWVVPRSGDFGPQDPSYFFLKVGTDPENFYLYRTRLPAPPAGGEVTASAWQPELVVDFEEWLDLRRRAEELFLVDSPEPGDPPVTVWSRDSTYAVVLKDRGRAPNLASVREMSMGVWNQGEEPIQGEVWVDELRLSGAVRDAGLASHVDVRLEGGGVLESRLTWSRRGALYRQLDEDPTYQDDGLLSLSSRLRLGRFTPAGWGLELPVSVLHERTTQDPKFLSETDVPARELQGLRETGTRQTRVSMGFRKTTPSADPLVGALVDGLDANVAWYTTSTSSVTARREAEGLSARLAYDRSMDRRDLGVVPGFLRPVFRALLPGFLEDALVDARLRWTPLRIGVSTAYERQDLDILRFDEILERPSEGPPTPTRAPRESMETAAEVQLRPFESTTADVTFLSTRDLLAPAAAVSDPDVRALLARERRTVGGVDLGWETRRAVRTRLGVRPRFLPWLEHGVDLRSNYVSDRNAAFVERTTQGPDTLLALQRSVNGERGVEAFVRLDPAAMGQHLFGSGAPPDTSATGPDSLPSVAADTAAADTAATDPLDPGPETAVPVEPDIPRQWGETLAGLVGRVLPVNLAWQMGLGSRFDRDPVSPGAAYQLGWGGVSSFRLLDGRTAATVTDRSAFDARSGLRLTGSMTLEVAYRRSDVDVLDTRSDRTVRDRTWPDLRAEVEDTDGWEGTPVDRAVVSAGLQRSTREVAFGGLRQQRREQEDVRIPVELTLGWAGAATLRYSGSFRSGDGVDPTGDTEREENFHSVSFDSSFLPPGWLGTGLAEPVQLGVIASYRGERECRVVRFRLDCVEFIDQINRALSLTLDTEVRGFEVGVQGSWNQRRSFVGQRFGSTQLQLTLFGQFLFEAGPPPASLRIPGSG